MSLGLRALERAAGEIGVHEIPGPSANRRILAYLAGCARAGHLLGLASDEIAWCAAFACWCEEGEQGWYAAVAEIWAEAVRRGTARAVGTYDPAPGDLAIWKRGGDPRVGGPGHVGRVRVAPGPDGAFTTIEGNHDNQVAEVARTVHDPQLVGWVVRGAAEERDTDSGPAPAP